MSTRRTVRSAVLAVLGLFGCSTDAGGPKAITVGVSITDMAGAPAAELCVRVPVLLGSVILQERKVGNAFGVELRALRHEAEVSFPGAANASGIRRSWMLATLTSGFAETLAVSGSSGESYSAVVRTGCKVVNDEDDP